MKTIDFEQILKQAKRKARRARAKARKQEHAKRMEEYKQKVSGSEKHESREHVQIFRDAQTARPTKKFRNNVSSQEAGTLKPYVTTRRFGYAAITCKTTKIY